MSTCLVKREHWLGAKKNNFRELKDLKEVKSYFVTKCILAHRIIVSTTPILTLPHSCELQHMQFKNGNLKLSIYLSQPKLFKYVSSFC